jgi:hypothetical protein
MVVRLPLQPQKDITTRSAQGTFCTDLTPCHVKDSILFTPVERGLDLISGSCAGHKLRSLAQCRCDPEIRKSWNSRHSEV